jgi:hypothetical protein
VKPTAPDQDLFDVGSSIAGLQVATVAGISRADAAYDSSSTDCPRFCMEVLHEVRILT